MVRARVRSSYTPANSTPQINAARAARGVGPTSRQAMDALLMSPQILKPTLEAAQAIMEIAEGIARVEAYYTGAYSRAFGIASAPPTVAEGGPRVTVRVVNTNEAAAAIEFGNRTFGPGRRIMQRAGATHHVPRHT